jgi:hypothetical protein
MKLIKHKEGYSLCIEETGSNSREFIATTDGMYVKHMLSKQNCDEIFGVIDVEKLANTAANGITFLEFDKRDKAIQHKYYSEGFKLGFNKAMELNKDKLFGIKEVVELCKILLGNPIEKCGKTYQELTDNYIQSLQQPTEIDVEIEMENYGYCEGCRKAGMWHCAHADTCGYAETRERTKLDENGCLILKKK